MKTCTMLLVLIAISLSTCDRAGAVLTDNLVGYYQFASDFTTSAGSVDGTAVNSPTAGVAGGIVGNAMSLDTTGPNDHINVALSYGTASTLGDTFSLSAWYNLNTPPAANATSRYFVFEGTTDFDVSFGIRNLSTGTAGINDGQIYTGGSTDAVFTNVPDAATAGWHHILQTYVSSAGTTTVSTYIDGVDIGDLTAPTTSLSDTGFNFGAARNSAADRGFDGLLDEIAIWDRELSADEIALVRTRGLAGQDLFFVAVPEPSSSMLLGLSMLGFVRHARRRRRKAQPTGKYVISS